MSTTLTLDTTHTPVLASEKVIKFNQICPTPDTPLILSVSAYIGYRVKNHINLQSKHGNALLDQEKIQKKYKDHYKTYK